jgi:hypothetical protein
MPKFYHITTTDKPQDLKKYFIEGRMLFFSKKNQYWYNILHHYEDRCKYEINIPTTSFTTSFQTKKKNSIFKLTVDNFMEYKKRLIAHGRQYAFQDNPNIIGCDLTIIETQAFQKLHWRKCTIRKHWTIDSEMFIWKFPPNATLKLINCIKNDGNILGDCQNIYKCNFPIYS